SVAGNDLALEILEPRHLVLEIGPQHEIMAERARHPVHHHGDRQVLLQRVEIAGRDAAFDHLKLVLRQQGDRVRRGVEVLGDAEWVLEGYLDARGHVESEGPYGEFLGYYGSVKRNPLFHLTAITRRRDALFQTSTIGGRSLGFTDTAPLNGVRTEAMIWRALETP